jgi:competence ComEA-like helix-hairpin-helix protein
MSSDSDPSSPESHAGAYGFTRREIIALAIVVAICLALGFFARWRDRDSNSRAAWVVEDVMVGGSESKSGIDESGRLNDSDIGADAIPIRSQSELINVNTADAGELAKLPGIGAELAKRIADERAAHGAFVNLSDLQRVRGIGPKKAAMLAGWVTFSRPALDTATQR